MGNIILVTHWLDGDVIPFVRIGKVLKERGHQVTLITHCHFQKMAEEAGIQFEPWDTPEEYAELVEEMNGNNTGGTLLNSSEEKRKNQLFKEKHEGFEVRMKEYAKITKYCHVPDTVIFCKNRSSIAAYMAAEKFRLPLISVMMNPTEIVSIISYYKLYHRDTDLFGRLRKEIGLGPINNGLQWEISPKRVLALWPKWYSKPDENWPGTVETIGFPLEEGKEYVKRTIPEDIKRWLSEHENPLLITGGTTKLINSKFYPLSIAACGKLKRPTIVLCRYRELLPDKLPDNVIWRDFLPLDEVMPYLGTIIHHGGMGTVAGALRAGVPQMILPCFVDRPFNAALIKEIGAGSYLYITKWDKDTIAAEIEKLNKPQVKEKCRVYAQKMKENKGVSLAADRIEEIIGNSQYTYELVPMIEEKKLENTDHQEQLKRKLIQQMTYDKKKEVIKRVLAESKLNRREGQI